MMQDHFAAFRKPRFSSILEGNQGNLGNQTKKEQQLQGVREVSRSAPACFRLGNLGNQDVVSEKADQEAQIFERQAFAEIEGGVHPSFVAGFVRLQMSLLEGANEAEWYQAINDAGLFLDSFGAKAAAFGWSPDDVFAASGLAWALKGASVTDISTTGAMLSDGRTFQLFG
jgi:hypothetical protein